jgi:hypothetical protein
MGIVLRAIDSVIRDLTAVTVVMKLVVVSGHDKQFTAWQIYKKLFYFCDLWNV